MPYVITHKLPEEIGPGEVPSSHAPEHVISVFAVATLDEAREAIITGPLNGHDDMPDATVYRLRQAVLNLPESGGTVGPLPDGTTIEVEEVDWAVLSERGGVPRTVRPAPSHRILAAFNAAHAVTADNDRKRDREDQPDPPYVGDEPLGTCVVHGNYWTDDCLRCGR